MRIARSLFFGCVCLLGLLASPAWADDSPPAGNDPHAQLQGILNRPEFIAWRLRQEGNLPEAAGTGKWSQFIQDHLQDIRDWIRNLFKRKQNTTTITPSTSGNGLPAFLKIAAWVIVGGLIIYLVIVLIKLLGLRPAVTEARVLSQEQVREALESGNALALDSSQWMEQAKRLASAQDFRAVYRALYLALLSGLHAAGKIEHNRNRTNWVYVEHYRGPAPERARFSDLTELFDRVWYGRKVAEENNLEQLRLDVAMLTRGEGAA